MTDKLRCQIEKANALDSKQKIELIKKMNLMTFENRRKEKCKMDVNGDN